MILSKWYTAFRLTGVRALGMGSPICTTRTCVSFTGQYHHSSLMSFHIHFRRELRHLSSSSVPPPLPSESKETDTQQPTNEATKMIRLSKRMGELDMFSRREADRLMQNGRVLLDGKAVEVGHKVPSDLRANRIEVLADEEDPSFSHSRTSKSRDRKVETNITTGNTMTAVILNKPKGYVSGQAEHGHLPAVRLLISRNRKWDENENDRDKNQNINNRNDDGYDHLGSNHSRIRRRHISDWKGFAPAGRLDLDSTGLLIFTKNGVLAKKLIGASSTVEKEYIVDVERAVCPTQKELAIDPNFVLPSFSSSDRQRFDLTRILRGGEILLGDNRPLKACPEARWIVEGKRLQIVLAEGRKHHIRRMCRELLGYHVVGLKRVRIGQIGLSPPGSLPEGCWRPLHQKEIKSLISGGRQ